MAQRKPNAAHIQTMHGDTSQLKATQDNTVHGNPIRRACNNIHRKATRDNAGQYQPRHHTPHQYTTIQYAALHHNTRPGIWYSASQCNARRCDSVRCTKPHCHARRAKAIQCKPSDDRANAIPISRHAPRPVQRNPNRPTTRHSHTTQCNWRRPTGRSQTMRCDPRQHKTCQHNTRQNNTHTPVQDGPRHGSTRQGHTTQHTSSRFYNRHAPCHVIQDDTMQRITIQRVAIQTTQ